MGRRDARRLPGEPQPEHDPIDHLAVVENADAYVVAPASANTVAKLAAGIADSMLTTSFLACAAPRLVAPAMNDRMYRDGATQRNLELLRERGVIVIEPDEEPLGIARRAWNRSAPQPDVLLRRVEAALPAPAGPWDGLRVLVTMSGTREPIDTVRFIGNRSSGRMGVALAEAAARRGADVTLVAANVSVPIAAGIDVVRVETAVELADAARAAFGSAHVVVMAAAVADFPARDYRRGKLSRRGSAVSTCGSRRPRT